MNTVGTLFSHATKRTIKAICDEILSPLYGALCAFVRVLVMVVAFLSVFPAFVPLSPEGKALANRCLAVDVDRYPLEMAQVLGMLIALFVFLKTIKIIAIDLFKKPREDGK